MRVTTLTSHVRRLITPLIATREPPSTAAVIRGPVLLQGLVWAS